MLWQMCVLDMVVDDLLLDDYINYLGYCLVVVCDKLKDYFVFFIVQDLEINVFVVFGGYIVVNLGLIQIICSESELVGVIVYEIGYIIQNYLQCVFEVFKKDVLLMVLVLLGVIVVGVGVYVGDVVGVILMGGQGVIMQKQINFICKDEIEVDCVGIQMFVKVDFDFNVMVGFFECMFDIMCVGFGGDDVLELLQDYLVIIICISDVKECVGVFIVLQKQWFSGNMFDLQQWVCSIVLIVYVCDFIKLLVLVCSGGIDMVLDIYVLMCECVCVFVGDVL